MSWFDVDLTLTTFFTPFPDDQTVCADANGARVCVPFSGRPISQAVGGTLGGSYVLANDAETLGGIFRLHVLGGGGNRHWQIGGGVSAGFLVVLDAIDLSIEAGYDAVYLSSTGRGSTDVSELLHTLSASIAVGGRITPMLKVFVAPRVLIPFGGENGVRAEAIAVLLEIGVAFALGRKPVPKEIVRLTPDPDEEARAAAVRAALTEAHIRLQRARQHLEPGWFATHVQERIAQTPGEPPVTVEIEALRDCGAWIQQGASDRHWPAAGRLPLQTMRDTIAASLHTVLAGNPSGEQRKAVGDILEAADTIVRDTATMLADQLIPVGKAPLLPRLIAWGRELKTVIAKFANGDPEGLEAQLRQYGRAILGYQETIGAVMPLVTNNSALLQDTLGALSCLNQAGADCKERFERLQVEAFDPTITPIALADQLAKKGKR